MQWQCITEKAIDRKLWIVKAADKTTSTIIVNIYLCPASVINSEGHYQERERDQIAYVLFLHELSFIKNKTTIV